MPGSVTVTTDQSDGTLELPFDSPVTITIAIVPGAAPAPEPPTPVPPGPDTMTLQARIDAAAAGSTLDLSGKTYPAGATIAKPLTLIGAAVTVPAGQKGIVIKSGQVTLDGIRFGGPGAATYADAERAIEAIGAYAAIAIRRCVIDGFRGWGMYLRRVVNPLVEDNEVSHIGYIGIGLLSAVGGTVRRNEVSYVGEDTNVGNERNAYGIVQTSANANEAQCTDVLVDRNTVHHVPHWHAFDCHAAIRPAFTNNVVHHSRKGFFLTGDSYGRSTSALVCTGNTITDPWSPVIGNATAILTAAVKGGKITGNTIKGFGTGTGAIYDFQGQSTALVTTPNTIV